MTGRIKTAFIYTYHMSFIPKRRKIEAEDGAGVRLPQSCPFLAVLVHQSPFLPV